MRRKVMATAMTGLLSASMVMNAFAAPGVEGNPDGQGTHGGVSNYENGTDVYAGVVLDDPDAKIKVEVPTLFAFVVNGTVDDEDTSAISVENGSLLLPNVMVEVDENSGTEGYRDYKIQTVGENKFYFDNFSTVKDENKDNAGRTGLAVEIKGSISNEGTDADRNYWTHVENAPGTDEGDFKHYRLTVDGKPFSVVEGDRFEMKAAVTLAAPDLGRTENAGEYEYTNLDEETNFAKYGEKTFVDFGVEVGGQRSDYKQVEQSAKVGTIVWTVSSTIKNSGDTATAPDNDYASEAGRETTAAEN